MNNANRCTWSEIPYETDAGTGTRAHIGLVAISNDQTLPIEARAMLTLPGIALYESRIAASRAKNEPVSVENLDVLFDKIEASLRLINVMRPSDVIALGCTSAAMVTGPEELERRVRNVHPHALVTDPFTAIKSALKALKSTRVGYISPYPRDLAARMVDGIESSGPSVMTAVTFHNDGGFIGDEAPFISLESISRAVRQVTDNFDVDTVVVACTQMRGAEIVEQLENETGVSITTSNHALCWHALRLAKYHDEIQGWGRLFRQDVFEAAR
ncbi:maleate cis-trans isomerase family protein [Burkholderia cepacia]|uniref:maleate cis-trans isomerase family protein n=1 Tax=Burkholderia cepacia TaxID=292 RepID=UPI002AB71A5A|nr:Asp/Glu/hydantoin racemase [Burkholderia cepacia]